MRENLVDYVIGCSLGHSSAPTMLAIVRVVWGHWDLYWGRRREVHYDVEQWHYELVHLERIPEGTSYPDILVRLRDRAEGIPQRGEGSIDLFGTAETRTYVAIDVTGVGAPIVKRLRDSDLHTAVMTITNGDALQRDPGGGYAIPKLDLIGTVQLALQEGRLHTAPLPATDKLLDELRHFKYSAPRAEAAESMRSWRENPGDDRVFAVAVAVWYAERTHHDMIRPLDPEIVDMLINFTGL